jgi:hypothetical protein
MEAMRRAAAFGAKALVLVAIALAVLFMLMIWSNVTDPLPNDNSGPVSHAPGLASPQAQTPRTAPRAAEPAPTSKPPKGPARRHGEGLRYVRGKATRNEPTVLR